MLCITKEDVGLSETLTVGLRNLQDGRDGACRGPGRQGLEELLHTQAHQPRMYPAPVAALFMVIRSTVFAARPVMLGQTLGSISFLCNEKCKTHSVYTWVSWGRRTEKELVSEGTKNSTMNKNSLSQGAKYNLRCHEIHEVGCLK